MKEGQCAEEELPVAFRPAGLYINSSKRVFSGRIWNGRILHCGPLSLPDQRFDLVGLLMQRSGTEREVHMGDGTNTERTSP
jgi:hypothetical protein